LRSNPPRICGISNFFQCRFPALRSQFLIPRFTCPPLADGQRRLTIKL
jgi:hypothetical protein